MEITKKQRLDAYRAGITASAQMFRADMAQSGLKAEVMARAMLKLVNIDPRGGESVSVLVVPLFDHVRNFVRAQQAHSDALEASELTDAELQRDHDEKHPERPIGRLHVRKAVGR